MDAMLFWLFAVVAVVASLLVVGQRNPMYSVLLLIVSFGALSGLYVLLARAVRRRDSDHHLCRRHHGALPVRRDAAERADRGSADRLSVALPGRRRAAAVRRRAVAAAGGRAVLGDGPAAAGAAAGRRRPSSTHVYDIGIKLFREYAFAFEATSVLILVAMVGAIILARKGSRT